MTTTLRDLTDLAVEVGLPVEAGALRLFPLFSASPAAAAYLCGAEAEPSPPSAMLCANAWAQFEERLRPRQLQAQRGH
jgi:hypothetical protein